MSIKNKAMKGLDLARLCRIERERKSLSVAALASLARVSNRSIATLEGNPDDGKSLATLLRQATIRQKRAWARVLARIAMALDQPVDSWLNWLQTVAEVSLPENERQAIVRGAKANVHRERERASAREIQPHENVGTWEKTLQRLSESPGGVKMPVGFLFSGQFSKKGPKDANSFLEEFVQRLFAVVNHRLKAQQEPLVNTVLELINGLNDASPRYDLIVGLFEIVGRRQYELNFIPIPGWKIQLACLAPADVNLTWGDVVRERQLPGQKRIRPITVADDVWDSYLRRIWGVDAAANGFIDTLKEYDLIKIAETFRSLFVEKESPRGFQPVLVTDQIVAAEVKRILSSRFKIDVKDIAAAEEGVPRYQLAMATRSTDHKWTQVLEDALQRELFQTEGSVMAELYSEYMLSILATDLPSLLEASKGGERLPSYLELQDFDVNVDAADSFFASLSRRLHSGILKLSKEHLSEPESSALDVLARSLLPPSQRGKPLHKPAEFLGNPVVEAILEVVGNQLGISGKRIRELLMEESAKASTGTLRQNQREGGSNV